MIRNQQLLWLLLLLAPPAFSQSTGTISQGQTARSCNAVTVSTPALPGAVGGCTALALLTSGGVLPNTYTFQVTGGTATVMGSLDGSSWTTLGSVSNTTQTFGGAFTWLGCVPTSVSGSLNCNVSVTVGNGGGGGGGGTSSVHINGTPAAQPNFNATTPPPPANSAPVAFQTDANDNVSAAIVGSGNSNDCFHGDGLFKPCAGGVGTGVVGDYAIYVGTSTVAGDANLTSDGTTITAALPISASRILQGTGSALNLGTSNPAVSAGMSQISITPTGVAVSRAGNTFFNVVPINVNGTQLSPSTSYGFNGTNANPAVCNPVAPANAKCISILSSGGSASWVLVGDGTSNCLSGLGTYVPCGSGGGGSGTVGAGNVGAFAYYPAQGTSVVGSPTLLDTNGTINSTEPFTAPNFLLSNPTGTLTGTGGTPSPVSGQGALGFLSGGIPAISINGGPFTAIATAAGGTTPISSLTAATAANTISNGDNSQVWNWNLTTAGNTGLNISESAPSTATGSSLVKISEPTGGTQAVALTVQSGASSASVPAFQVQNSLSQNVFTISSGGTVSTNASYQTILTAGLAQLCGGSTNCTTSNSSAAGGARVRGSDNTATSANGSGGSAMIAAGAITSSAPLASQVNNVTQLASPFYCNGTCTLTTVMCSTGVMDQVTACATTPQGAVLGISAGTGAGTSVWVTSTGTAQVRVDNTAVVGHTLCTSTTTAGSATDSGGTGPCTSGQQIGVVMAISGTTAIPNGVSVLSVTFSASAPKVALALARGGGGSGTVGSGAAGQFAYYSTTANTVVGNPNFVDNGALLLALEPLMPGPAILGNGISQIGASPTGGQVGFVQSGANFTPFFGFRVGGTAVATTAAAPYVNLDPATPAAPTNGRNVTWSVSNNSVSGAIVGDGSLNCLSGQGTYVTCGGGGGGVSGTGTATHLPVWSSATALGDSPVTFTGTTAVPTGVNIAASATPLQPSTGVAPGQAIGAFVVNRVTTCPASGTTAGPAFNKIGVSDIGCSGMWLSFSQANNVAAGQNAGLLVSSGSGANGNLGMGIASLAQAGSAIGEERAGYFQAVSSGGLATTNRGMYAVALNDGSSSVVMPLNEAVVAQTGNTLNAGGSAAATTTDYTVHVLTPKLGSGSAAQLMTTHAGLKVESQSLGVELQTGPHAFANLPACSATYEGSIAAITDSTVTSGTIAGGGANHVQAYCNGNSWTVSAGGGGGATTTGPMICTNMATLGFGANLGHTAICTFSLPAVAHNYIVRCVYSVNFTAGVTQVSDVDFGIDITQAPAQLTYFRGTFTDPSKTFADQSSVSNVQGTAGNGGVANSFNLVRGMNLGNSTTGDANQQGWAITIDGVWPAMAVAQTLTFFAGSSLAGTAGNVLPGAYCRLE